VPGYAAFLRDPYQLPDGFHAIWKADGRWYILCEDPPAVYTEIVRDKGSYVEAAMALKMELMRLIYGPPQAGGGSREVTYGRTDRGSAGTQDAHQRNRDDQAAEDQSLFRRGERERDGAANDGQHLDRLFVRVVRLATDPYYHAKYTPQAIQQVAESAIRAFMQHRGIF